MAAYLRGEGLDVNRESTSMWALTPSDCNWFPGRSVKMPTTWGRMSRSTAEANGVPSARVTPDSSVVVCGGCGGERSASQESVPVISATGAESSGLSRRVTSRLPSKTRITRPLLAASEDPVASVGMVDSSVPSVPSPRPLIAAQGMVASKLRGA